MKTISDYFDDAKAITGSDRQTAIRLGVERQVISKQRSRDTLSNELCMGLAAIIGEDPIKLIAASSAKKNPEFWSRWVAAIAVVSILTFANEPMNTGFYANSVTEHGIYYAQLLIALIGVFIGFVQILSDRAKCAHG